MYCVYISVDFVCAEMPDVSKVSLIELKFVG